MIQQILIVRSALSQNMYKTFSYEVLNTVVD